MKEPSTLPVKRARRKLSRYGGQYLVRMISLEFNDDFWERSGRADYIVALHYSRQSAEKAATEYYIREVMEGGDVGWARVHMAYMDNYSASFADSTVWEIFGYSSSSGEAEKYDLTKTLPNAWMLGKKFTREQAEILVDRIPQLASHYVESRTSGQGNLDRVRIVYPDGPATQVLSEAIWGLPLERIRVLLADGADTEVRANEGNTVLLNAICAGRTDVLSPLISHGADVLAVNKYGSNALQLALRYHPRPERVIRRVLATIPGRDRFGNDSTLLMDALVEGEYEAFQVLTELGVMLEKSDITDNMVEELTRRLEPEAIDYLKSAGFLQQGTPWNRLLKLIEAEKEAQKMRELMKGTGLAHLRDLDSEGRNALQATLLMPRMDVPDWQKAMGWDLDVNHRDNHGRTPIHYAAMRGSSYPAKQLVDAGADVNALDNDGKGVIDYLPEEQTIGRANFAIDLFKWGVPFRKDVARDWFLVYIAAFQSEEWLDNVLADLDGQERIEQINDALMQVAMTGDVTAMRRLMARGADPCSLRPSGHTALQASLWRRTLEELKELAGYFLDIDRARQIVGEVLAEATRIKRSLVLAEIEPFAEWLASREQ